MRFFRSGAGVLCSAFLLAGTACGAAEAHGYFAASFPPAKAHLKRSPHTIKLHFSLRADARYSTIELEDEDGAVLASKTQQRASRDMDMSAPMLAPGRYHVRYRILSPDGDVVQGKIDFIIDN
jgi:methionine-rich copper-binding protein CopC